MPKTYEFHPLANKYPLLEGEPFQQMCENMRLKGLGKKITLYEGKILDGRNRYRACLEVGLPPQFEKYTGDDPEGFVERENDVRRHETAEALRERRQERIKQAAELRSQGKSLREIGETLGTSHQQAKKDLEEATVKGFTVEPEGGKVTGLDGRTRTATPSKPPTESPGAVEREPGCDDDVFDQKDAERDAKRKQRQTKQAAKDGIGQSIPACQKDIFGDPILPDAIGWLQGAQDEAERLVERLKRKILNYPFVLIEDAYKHLHEAAVALQCARESLAAGVPYAVCPKCQGKKCKVCRNAGHFPQWRHDELVEQEALA